MTTYGALAIKPQQACARQNSSRSHLRLVYDKTNSASQRKTKQTPSQVSGSPFVRLAIVFALIACITSIAVGNIRNQAVCNSLGNAQTQSICVMPGDTLWSIAERHAVEGVSTYDEVQWIRAQNNLSTAELRVGANLVVPI